MIDGPRIVLLCATRRGSRFLERLIEIAPGATITVVSFPEEPGEPPFLEELRSMAMGAGLRFVEARNVGHAAHTALWDPPPDLLFAVSWRYMVPPAVYRLARRGAFVFHDSLLPEYRGFAPTVWALVNGERQTGVTLFEMADAVDSGAIVDQEVVPIGADDTVAEVMERVTTAYLSLVSANLRRLIDGNAPRREQDHARATYTCKRTAADGRIDWSAGTSSIYNLVRAHTRPYWGAFTTLDGRTLRVWKAQPVDRPPRYVGRVPGRVVAVERGVGTTVLTGDGAIVLVEVEIDGEVTDAPTILRSPGQTLGR